MAFRRISRLTLRSSFGADASATLVMRVATYFLGLASAIATARLLGPGGKGELSLALSFAGMATLLLSLGLGSAATIEIREQRLCVGQVVSLLQRYALVGAGIVLGLSFFGHIDQTLGLQEFHTALQAVSVAVGGLLLIEFSGGVMQGLGRVKEGSFSRLAPSVLQPVAFLALAAASVTTVSAYVWCFSSVVVGAGVALWLRARHLSRVNLKERRVVAGLVPRIVRLGLQNQAIWLLLMLNYRLDMLLLGALAGPAQVGVYSIAVAFSEVAWFGVNSLVAVQLPYSSGTDEATAIRRAELASRISLATTACTSGVIAVFLGLWAGDIFGKGFAGSPLAFVALVPGLLSFSVFKVVVTFLVGRRVTGLPALVAAAGLVVNVLANLWLIPLYGAAGASLASSLSYTLVTVLIVAVFVARCRSRVRSPLLLKAADFSAVLAGMGHRSQ